MDEMILNEPVWSSPYLEGKDPSIEFGLALQEVCANHYDKQRNRLDYRNLASTKGYKQLFRMAHALPNFKPERLENREARLSFWLNVYNAMVIHMVVAANLEQGPMEIEGFFAGYRYRIGEHYFSLDDIEHGILRANARKYMGMKSHFSARDPRATLRLRRVDPRIHFAFACGAISSPPLRSYPPEQVDELLDQVTAEYLGNEVELDRRHARLRIPKQFKWYKKDFGSDHDVVQFIVKHLPDPVTNSYIVGNLAKMSLSYLDFDWQLNVAD